MTEEHKATDSHWDLYFISGLGSFETLTLLYYLRNIA